eukprot:Nitzschia sp. Nitz4//scaffold4_size323378//77213//78466//NITZ4_000637-RA/size323378-processed-gene-0.338-mRNA-1//-1//CDS//3329553330//5319//frame0
MVTWGQNTTHTFGTGTPATGATPVPAGGLFGSAPAPAAFGSPAPGTSLFGSSPAPGGSLFGSSPAPAAAPTTSLFGAPAPSPGGSLFGSTPAPAPGTSLFGAPSTGGSLFGTPAPAPSAFGSTTSLFGAPAPANAATQQQPQIPAQAALQAHMDAAARQEAERVRSALETLHAAYAGTTQPSGSADSKFVAIVYNPLTPEQRQLQWIHGMGQAGVILEPERPPQVSDKQWKKAVVDNPDPQNYMPQALVGAAALEGRIAWQQSRANELGAHVATLSKSRETLQDRAKQAHQDVEERAKRHAALRKRLLDVMRRVELARCMNQPIQPDELKALQRISALYREVETVRGVLVGLQNRSRSQDAAASDHTALDMPETSKVLPILTEQRQKLEKLVSTVQKDQRDISLIQKRTATSILPRA